jgi:hypothetical protein
LTTADSGYTINKSKQTQSFINMKDPCDSVIRSLEEHSSRLNKEAIIEAQKDNEELFELIRSIEVTENREIRIKEAKFIEGVSDYEAKIKSVLLGLSKNLIFNISSSKLRP